MRQTINNSLDSITSITNFNCLNSSVLKKLKINEKEYGINNNSSLNKLMYEEWCVSKLNNKRD